VAQFDVLSRMLRGGPEPQPPYSVHVEWGTEWGRPEERARIAAPPLSDAAVSSCVPSVPVAVPANR
jgi:hypothetical protein